MEIGEQKQGAVTVLRPLGALVLGDADQFRARVNEVMQRCMGRFVIDASGVPYVDSKGLEALVAATDELANSGRALSVAGANETMREVLEITGLSDRFEYYEDVQSAVRSFL